MKDPGRTSYLNKAKTFLSTPAALRSHFLRAAVFITGIVLSHHHNEDFIYVGWNILHAPTMLLLNILAGAAGIHCCFSSDQKIGFFMAVWSGLC